jgi:predicted DCC family thiol-disulfide oxidoreductase YuxK
LALLPFDDEETRAYVPDVSDAELRESWHLVMPNGERLTARAASLALLEHLRPTRPIAALVRRLSLGWAVDAAYRFANRHRARLGRFVPDVEPPRRPPGGEPGSPDALD